MAAGAPSLARVVAVGVTAGGQWEGGLREVGEDQWVREGQRVAGGQEAPAAVVMGGEVAVAAAAAGEAAGTGAGGAERVARAADGAVPREQLATRQSFSS